MLFNYYTTSDDSRPPSHELFREISIYIANSLMSRRTAEPQTGVQHRAERHAACPQDRSPLRSALCGPCRLRSRSLSVTSRRHAPSALEHF
jgi:hypothetical protein